MRKKRLATRCRFLTPRLLGFFVAAALLLMGASASAQSKKGKKEAAETPKTTEVDEGTTEETPASSLQRGSRMEFDGRLIRGETASSGAVFLFERVPRALPTMVDRRQTYLPAAVSSVLGPQHAARCEAARAKALLKRRTGDDNAASRGDAE